MTKADLKPDLSVFDREKRCVVAAWVDDELTDDDKATLGAAWTSRYSAHAIFEWLDERDMPYTEQSVWRHRVGRCGCRPRRNLLREAA